MAAVTLTELSTSDMPFNNVSGSGKRRVLVAVRYTSAATSDTLDLSSYITGVSDIEGLVWDSMNSAVAATSATWSGAVLTAAGHSGSGVGEIGIIVNLA